MTILEDRRARRVLLCCLTFLCLVAVVSGVRVKAQRAQDGQQDSQRILAAALMPPEGKTPEIDTGGEVPGDPAHAVEDMRKLYSLMNAYRTKHGVFPKSTYVLSKDVTGNFQEYGFSSRKEARSTFVNPDNRYSDSPVMRNSPGQTTSYLIVGERLDGTPVGGPKAPGTRDVRMMTDLYFHMNVRHYKNTRSSSNPVGFYLVMWDDGQIEKIPYDKVLWVPSPTKGTGRSYRLALVGEAGVPAGALTYDQYYQQLGWKTAPRGTKGGKGQTYDGRHP